MLPGSMLLAMFAAEILMAATLATSHQSWKFVLPMFLPLWYSYQVVSGNTKAKPVTSVSS